MPLLQLSVISENKPGAMAKLASVLDRKKIRVFALSIAEAGEVGLIRMVVNDAEVVVRQLESEGFMLAKSKKNVEVIAVLITEQHSLSEITRLLDDNEVNIDYAYSSSIHLNGKSGLILRVSDPDKSERILKENGIRTLTTTDLQ